eukprot:tig00021357_g20757.t1
MVRSIDPETFRYMTKEESRVLTSVEQGMKNHELVPTPLIESISNLRGGGAHKVLRVLLRNKMVHHDAKKYDGYCLTYAGYDALAIRSMTNRQSLVGLAQKIGVGKESDIYLAVNEANKMLALKLHRLGRTSFRTIKTNRDYLKHRSSASWLYLSRLAALKEYAFMKALYENKFPVPEPVDVNRHCVLMSLVDGCPLYQVKQMKNPARVYRQCMDLIVRLAECGLIHGDLNEYNILISEDEKITLIDFPQMVSTSHENAEMYFDRDVECIVRFFSKKMGYEGMERPNLESIQRAGNIDVAVAASGWSKQHQKQMDGLLSVQNVDEKQPSPSASDDSSDDEDDEEEEEEAEGEEEAEEEDEGQGARSSGGMAERPSVPSTAPTE